mmetsp:Transcript_42/g.67  ORF Transcript_42/g.67 Transcript_42/m.67 type:complete len:254 (-) Transcript_42:143-904(-)
MTPPKPASIEKPQEEQDVQQESSSFALSILMGRYSGTKSNSFVRRSSDIEAQGQQPKAEHDDDDDDNTIESHSEHEDDIAKEQTQRRDQHPSHQRLIILVSLLLFVLGLALGLRFGLALPQQQQKQQTSQTIKENSVPTLQDESSTVVDSTEALDVDMDEGAEDAVTATPTTTKPPMPVVDCFPPFQEGEFQDFPCLLGMDGDAAMELLQESYPFLEIHVLHELSPVTMDLRFYRVRIFVNDDGKVSIVPQIG